MMPFLRQKSIYLSSMIFAVVSMSSAIGGRNYTIFRREAIFGRRAPWIRRDFEVLFIIAIGVALTKKVGSVRI